MDIIKSKKKILTIIMVVLLIIIGIGAITLFTQNTLTQTNGNYILEAGQKISLNASNFFDADEEKASQITFDTSAVDTDTVGEYIAIANFKNKTFEIKVSVVDTTAPEVKLSSRYVFTNNMEHTSLDNLFTEVSELSEWSAKLIRYEKYGNLKLLDDKALKSLTDSLVPYDATELSSLGTDEVPTEPGIYRALLEVTDIYGNSTLEEIYVIYDTTGARIDDTPDKTVYVEKEDLDKAPEIDKSDYFITDNVDGKITNEDIQCELKLRNAEKHEWLVHVSYTDRAGNDSKADFLIIVKEKQTTTASNNGGSTTPSGNGETTPSDTGSGNVGDGSSQELVNELSPSQQKVVNAGYGIVVQLDSGDYAVLTHGDGCVNGKGGGDILREYLAEKGLVPQNVSGGWIDSNNDWYCWVAKNITEPVTPDDEAFWD